MLYRNTDKVFNSICENIVCSCNCTTPNIDCSLTLELKNSINPESNIVFINCVIPRECPPNYSLKAIKFTNWLRNMIIEQNQNISKIQNENNYNTISYNNMNLNMNMNINESNNNNTSLSNNSIQRLPSAQRNNAYGNNYEPKKNITIVTNNNKMNYLEKENDNNYYNLNTYQNKIDKNNGLFRNINMNMKSDYEEQVGNLAMLNNNPELINVSNNNQELINNKYTTQQLSNRNNDMNYSANLPNLPNMGKIHTNYQNYLTQQVKSIIIT